MSKVPARVVSGGVSFPGLERREREREHECEREISGVSSHKDTSPIRSPPHPYDLV